MALKAPRVFLASSSPQRYRLLQAMELDFSVISPDIDETPKNDENPSDYVLRLAVQKSAEAVRMAPQSSLERIFVGADTCVSIDEHKLGKPENLLEARQMLEQLSGEIHQVYSAVSVTNCRITRCVVAVSEVEFNHLSETQIQSYLASGESENRAGAYAIQGRAVAFINRVVGSLTSVIGMPVKETAELLELAGVSVPSYASVAGNVLAEFQFEHCWPDDYYI